MDARTLEVGISIIPYADSLDRSRELVRVADESGHRETPKAAIVTS